MLFGKSSRLLDQIGSFLYPEQCVTCGAPDTWLCRSCERRVSFLCEPLIAPLLPSGRPLSIDRVFALAKYTNAPWANVITSIKYSGLRDMERTLIPIISRTRETFAGVWPFGEGEGFTLVPIPTNPDHIEERGNDHALVWLRVFAHLLPKAEIKTDLLRRRSGRAAHASLRVPGAREAAAEDAVTTLGPIPERVILIDDVYTTGSTIQFCGRLLREEGARQVEALVAAASF